jgi:hypothetical protein
MAKTDLFDQLVRKIIREENTQIKIEDAKKIVQVIMPEIDRVIEEKVTLLCGNVDAMIANKVSEHFLLMGVYMSDKFKPHGE